jgi:hypothetical protein
MVQLSTTFSAFAAVLALALAIAILAHPHGTPEELAAREVFQHHARRSLAENCCSKLRVRNVKFRAAERRADFAQRMRAARGIALDTPYRKQKRQLASVEESHHSNKTDLTSDSNPFEDDYSGCVLDPEVTQGPYRKFLLMLWFVAII